MEIDTHRQYLNRVTEYITNHLDYPVLLENLCEHAHTLLILIKFDLSLGSVILSGCYSSRPRGEKPIDPTRLLRSMLLMLLCQVTNINKWVATTRTNPLLAALAGFAPGQRPAGVGTYYDFMARLEDGPPTRPCPHFTPPSLRRRARAATPRLLEHKL